MKTNISSLKQHLSENLQEVKNGKTILVLERKTPIARIVPYRREKLSELSIRPPIAKFRDMKLGIRVNFDPLDYLDKEDKWFTT